jgi:hypothetical protein
VQKSEIRSSGEIFRKAEGEIFAALRQRLRKGSALTHYNAGRRPLHVPLQAAHFTRQRRISPAEGRFHIAKQYFTFQFVGRQPDKL